MSMMSAERSEVSERLEVLSYVLSKIESYSCFRWNQASLIASVFINILDQFYIIILSSMEELWKEHKLIDKTDVFRANLKKHVKALPNG